MNDFCLIMQNAATFLYVEMETLSLRVPNVWMEANWDSG